MRLAQHPPLIRAGEKARHTGRNLGNTIGIVNPVEFATDHDGSHSIHRDRMHRLVHAVAGRRIVRAQQMPTAAVPARDVVGIERADLGERATDVNTAVVHVQRINHVVHAQARDARHRALPAAAVPARQIFGSGRAQQTIANRRGRVVGALETAATKNLPAEHGYVTHISVHAVVDGVRTEVGPGAARPSGNAVGIGEDAVVESEAEFARHINLAAIDLDVIDVTAAVAADAVALRAAAPVEISPGAARPNGNPVDAER